MPAPVHYPKKPTVQADTHIAKKTPPIQKTAHEGVKLAIGNNPLNPGQNGVRLFKLGDAFASLAEWRAELDSYRDILLGRQMPPIDRGAHTLQEVSDAYFARAKEIEQIIMRSETDGQVTKGSKTYHFRTGELRSFIELSKAASELGSRRVTYLKMEMEDG